MPCVVVSTESKHASSTRRETSRFLRTRCSMVYTRDGHEPPVRRFRTVRPLDEPVFADSQSHILWWAPRKETALWLDCLASFRPHLWIGTYWRGQGLKVLNTYLFIWRTDQHKPSNRWVVPISRYVSTAAQWVRHLEFKYFFESNFDSSVEDQTQTHNKECYWTRLHC